MSIQYIKQFEDGSTVATDVAPTYGSVSAVGDYYLNGLWYDNTGVVYTEQFTYASKEGKLLGVEIANNQPVDLHYDEYAPTLVEDTIKATNIISDNYVGKNACTAWVNFDGTTTPPTIRDSFNISDVVRTATGTFDIYFEEYMDNVNYSVSGTTSSESNGGVVKIITADTTLSKLSVITGDIEGTSENKVISVFQVFGGK